MKKVAYILVCWNNEALLHDCIESIDAQTYKERDIYLIDNNSKDGSVAYVEKNYPNVKLTKSKYNNGFAKGNNILIKKAIKDPDVGYFALINTDARIDADWTEKLVEVSESHSKAATLQGLTLDFFNSGIIDSHHIFLAHNLQATQYGYKHVTHIASPFTREVQGVNAAAAIVTRAFVEEQPKQTLFDESFFMYLEDVDVALRAQATGWRNYFVGDAIAHHMGSASSMKQSSSFSLYYTARNQPGMLVKNIPLKILINAAPQFLRIEFELMKRFRRDYPKGTLKAYIKGRIIGYSRALLYLRKRRAINRKREIDTEFLWAIMKGKGYIN